MREFKADIIPTSETKKSDWFRIILIIINKGIHSLFKLLADTDRWNEFELLERCRPARRWARPLSRSLSYSVANSLSNTIGEGCRKLVRLAVTLDSVYSCHSSGTFSLFFLRHFDLQVPQYLTHRSLRI